MKQANEAVTVVIKYGGHAMDIPNLAESFANDIAKLSAMHYRFVIVHGGGPQISSLLQRLGIQSTFIDGLRVTDAKTLEAVEMALCGSVNKSVVSLLAKKNVRAVGLSGRDANLLRAEQIDPKYGLVGTICEVTSDILKTLLDTSYVPIVAPLANTADATPLNINADTAAGAIAGDLNADAFILLSDVPGVLDQDKKRIAKLTREHCEQLKESGVIVSGMIPKVAACHYALSHGAKKAILLDGREENCLVRYLVHKEELGTVFIP